MPIKHMYAGGGDYIFQGSSEQCDEVLKRLDEQKNGDDAVMPDVNIVVAATAESLPAYVKAMAKINRELVPLASKFGGLNGMTNGKEPAKPALLFSFNSEASAVAFEVEACKSARARTWFGTHKLPDFTMRRE